MTIPLRITTWMTPDYTTGTIHDGKQRRPMSPNEIAWYRVADASEKAWFQYLQALPPKVGNALLRHYNNYTGTITDEQIQVEMAELESNLMRSHQKTANEQEAKETAIALVQQEKIRAAAAKTAFFAHAAEVSPTPGPMFVGSQVKAARLAAGITQLEFALALGTSQKTISSYEAGSTPVPPERLPTIAALFQLPIEHFTDKTV